jgi:hypothetical protein
MRWADFRKAWNRFFFEPQTSYALATFRIFCGLIAGLWLLNVVESAGLFFGADSPESIAAAHTIYPAWPEQILDLVPSSIFGLRVFILVGVLASFSLAAGIFARSSALVALVVLQLLCLKHPLIWSGGCRLLRVALLFLIFSRSGDVLRLLPRPKARKKIEALRSSPWVQRMLQLQMVGMYYSAFWVKANGSSWLDGTALYYVPRFPALHRYVFPILFDYPFTVRAMTWGTLVVEFTLFSLVWIREIRYYVLAAGVILHIGIDLTIEMPYFEWVAMAFYVLFIDEADVIAFISGLKGRVRALGAAIV